MTAVATFPAHLIPTAGRLGHLTSSQEQILNQFQASISQEPFFDPLRHTPHLCLKFLRARQFDLDAALAMLQACEEWRAKNNVTALISFRLTAETRAALLAVNPKYYHKTDRVGRPVYYECLSRVSKEAIEAVADEETLLKNHLASYEMLYRILLPACSAAAGRHLEDICFVMDLKGQSSMKAMALMNLMKSVTDISKNYYPEGLFRTFIINMPLLLRGLYHTFASTLMDPATREKTVVLGSSYEKTLLEYIPSENLPAYYGGSCVCEGGCENSDEGPWKAHFAAAAVAECSSKNAI